MASGPGPQDARWRRAGVHEFFELYFQPVYRFALSRLDRQTDLRRRWPRPLFAARWRSCICSAARRRSLPGSVRSAASVIAHRRRTVAGRLLGEDVKPTAERRDRPRSLRSAAAPTARGSRSTSPSGHGRLPRRYAQALAWKYTDELSVAEIAHRLGVSAKAAESLLTRARAFRAHFPMSRSGSASSSNDGTLMKDWPPSHAAGGLQTATRRRSRTS